MREFKIHNTTKTFTFFVFILLILNNLAFIFTNSKTAEIIPANEEYEGDELSPLDHGMRAEYTTDHIHPNGVANSDGDSLDYLLLDEDAGGDALYQQSGDTNEPSEDWIEVFFPSADVPAAAKILSITYHFGYYTNDGWQLTTDPLSDITWRVDATENDLGGYALSVPADTDIDTMLIQSLNLPAISDLNSGNFKVRFRGLENGGGPDHFYLDYCYFTVSYSIPSLVINEIMADPVGKGPYDVDWSYRKRIEIDHTKVQGDLADFPVLISITDSDLATKAQSDGDDILFTASDAETKLDHEVCSYSNGTGRLYAWVKVPLVSSTHNTVFYMYYGNSVAENQENAAGVWSNNFRGVWHLDDTSGDTLDSTSYSFSGTPDATIVRGETGQIGNAYLFDGVDAEVDFGSVPDGHLDFGTDSMTMSCWAKINETTGYQDLVSKGGSGSVDGGYAIRARFNGEQGYFRVSDTVISETNNFRYANETWVYLVGVCDRKNSELRAYENGVEQRQDDGFPIDGAFGSIDATSQDFEIGDNSETPEGWIDEVRVSFGVRSEDWVMTEYNNQHSPSTFILVGSEEATSGASSDYEWVELYNYGNISIDLTGWFLRDNDGCTFDLTGAGSIPSGGYLVCHLDQQGVNSSTDVYGMMDDIIIRPGVAYGKDNYLLSNGASLNFGTGTIVSVRNDSAAEHRPILQFDVSNVPDNMADAKLWLYRSSGNSFSSNIHVHSLTQSWTESGSNWNTYDGTNSWATLGGDYHDTEESSTTVPPVNGWYSWDITDLVKGWVNGTYPNYGMLLRADYDDANDPNPYFRSSDYTDYPNLRPKLVINITSNNLDYTDGLYLYHNSNAVIDYVAWGGDAGSGDDDAVSVGYWNDGEYVDTSSISEGESFGRDRDSTDCDSPSDWEGPETGKADPFGIHAGSPTQGSINMDQSIIINEVMFNPTGNPYESTWEHKKKITIHAGKVAGDLSDFPVVLDMTLSDLATYAQPDGDDILFVGRDGDTKLAHEIEHFDGITGRLVVWIKIPFLSSTHDTEIYMYYGNPSTQSQQNPHEVWTNGFVGVYHLKETGEPYVNSVSNRNYGTQWLTPTQVTGKLGYGQEFTGGGEDDMISLGNPGLCDGTHSHLTISAWAYIDDSSLEDYAKLISKRNEADTGYEYHLGFDTDASDKDLYFCAKDESTSYQDVAKDCWVHLTGTYNGNTKIFYINGTEATEDSDSSGPLAYSNWSTVIGAQDGPSQNFAGVIDEVRICDVNRSLEWIATEWYNQLDPSAFFSIDDCNNRKSITINSSQVSGDLTDFPVFIHITDSDLSANARGDGHDIYFTSSDGTTRLHHEIVAYDGSTGELKAWVRIPSLSSTEDTTVYMYYNNPLAGDHSNPKRVWDDDFRGVWHLNEVPRNDFDGAILDSSSYMNNLEAQGLMDQTNLVSGRIDGAFFFDGNDDYLYRDDYCSESLDVGTSDFTIEAWVQLASSPSSTYPTIAGKGGTGSTTAGYWFFDHNSNDDIRMYFGDGDGSNRVTADTKDNIEDGQWHHMVVTVDRNGPVLFYIDGEFDNQYDASVKDGKDLSNNGQDFTISDNSDVWDGLIDEVHISYTVRSWEWINTSYKNIMYSSSFCSAGSEESYSPGSACFDEGFEWVELYNPSSSLCNLGDLYLSDYEGNLFDLSGGGLLAPGGYLIAHLGESGTNSSTDVYGPIINYISFSKSMLDDADTLSVKSSQGYILDFIAWGQDPNSDDYYAVKQGVWSDNRFVDTSGLKENETLGRDKDSRDLNSTSDWENPICKADAFGIHSLKKTPGAINLNPSIVINEVMYKNESYNKWTYRKKITINASQVDSDLTNFPVLISFTDTDLRRKAQVDGDDIKFTASDGSTQLNHEIERYDSATGELIAWVNVTSVSGSTNTDIYMYYGNPDADDQSNPSGVWDHAYVGVWHLSEGYEPVYDSTSNDNDGSLYGDVSLAGGGEIGSGSEYEGSYNNSVNIADDPTLDPTSITVECWWSTDVLLPSNGDFHSAISKADTGWNDGYIMGLYRNNGASFNGFMFFSDFGDWEPALWDISNVAVGSWYWAAGTYNSGTDVTKLFINGSEVDSASNAGAIVGTSDTLRFGTHDWNEWDGKLDEVRISNIVRSDAWLSTTFNCQYNTNTFISVASEESTGVQPQYEWVEIYNGADEAVNVSGWYITDNDGNKFYITGAGEISPGEYLVCHLAESGTNSSTNVYGPIISEDSVVSYTIQPGPAHCKDAVIYNDNPTDNKGSDGWMEVMDWDTSTGDSYPLIEFDLSGFTPNDIVDANLWAYRYEGAGGTPAYVSICRLIQSWTESGVTWNMYDGTNNWYMGGGDFNPDIYDYVKVQAGIDSWYKWNITELVDCWKDGTYSNYGMVLLGNAESDWQIFYTSDYEEETPYRPKLVINYTVSTPQQFFMLEDTDDLALYDGKGVMVDYLAWGADALKDDDEAVSWRLWTDKESIDTSLLTMNQTLGRDAYSTDTDRPEDWENPTGFADPFGVHRSNSFGASPMQRNIDPIIGGPNITGVSADPNLQITGAYVNISCEVTDPDGVLEVWLNISLPAGGNFNVSMQSSGGDIWFFNTTYDPIGTYQYTIWSSDTLGNWTELGPLQFMVYDSVPQFSFENVDPPSGYIETWFNFSVSYSDLGNFAPGRITLNITGTGVYDLVGLDSLDTDYSDGKIYYFNISGFAVGIYSFYFAANNTLGNWNVSNTLQFTVQDRDPALTSGQVDPAVGYTDNWYNFSVCYTDLDNHAPNRVTVNITGLGVYDLVELDSWDTDYSDGKIYYCNMSGFAVGIYSFYFAANNTFGNWNVSNTLQFTVQNRDLALTSGQVDPAVGYTDNWYNFSVCYTDLDNHAPNRVTVNITGLGVYDLVELDSLDTDYSDGKLYYFNLSGFVVGDYNFHFAANATLGSWVETGVMQFQVLNRAPQLTSEQVIPDSGFIDESYHFSVTYSDLDNHASGTVCVNITGIGTYILEESDIMDTDYTDGKDYHINLSGLPVGSYNFHFAANDTLGERVESPVLQFEVINRAPFLSTPQVDPSTGFAQDYYNFTVNFTDFDNHYPQVIYVNITNLGTFACQEVDSQDTDCTDGKRYYYNTTLSNGSYSFHFSASDSLGMWASDTPEIFGPNILQMLGILDILDITEEYSDEIILYATLLDIQNDPIPGENVSFFIDLNNDGTYHSGELVGYGNTQFDGVIEVIFPMNIEQGTYNYTAVYMGSDDYRVENDEAQIEIIPKPATLTTLSAVADIGTTIYLNATLVDSEGDAIGNEPVLFYIDKSRNGFYEHSELIILVTTSASGLASINYSVNLTPENYGVRARYIGSENYLVTEIEGLLTVQSTGNNPPIIQNIVPHQIKSEDSLPWVLDLTPFEDDIEDYGPNLNWYLTGINVSLYTVTGMNSSNDLFTFIPVPNAYGSNKVVLWLVDSDGDKDSQILWVNITPVNDLPYFKPIPPDLFVRYDNPDIDSDDPTPWDYTYYVHDIETPKENLIITTSEPATYSSEGWIEVDGLRATFHYPQDMVGKSVFITLTLSDDADFVQTIISVNITSDWVPELVGKLPNVVIWENSTIYNVFDLDDYFTDKDHDSLYFSSGYSHIRVDINENNSVDITSFGEWTGSELVTFRAMDPIGAIAEDTITVTILPVNNGPGISNVPNLVVHYDYSYPFDLTPYIHDIDNLTSDLLVWTSESTDFITIQENNNLGIIVNYPASMNGLSIPVTIYVSDGFEMDSYEILVNVTDNFPPELVNTLPDVYFSEDTTLENAFILSDYFLDVDSAVLYYTEGTDFINVTINNDFSVNFRAPENWYGSEMVTFRATDSFGALAEDMIIVVVVPVNDAPIIKSIPRQQMNEGDQWILDISQYLEDVDNDISELKISVESEAGEGYVTLVGTILIFQYPEGIEEDMVSVTVSDSELETTRSFVVRIISSDIVAPTLWDIIPWPWVFSILLIALGGAIILYRKSVGYQVYEAYLIHEKGLPIANVTQDEGYELEDVLVSGMFTAVQDFIGDTFSSKSPDDDWELDEMKFGENKILIERSKNLFLAVIFEGHGKKLRLKVKKLLGKINDEYAEIFEDWNGDMTELGKINTMIMDLISKKPAHRNRKKKSVVLMGPEDKDDPGLYDAYKQKSGISEPSIEMLEGFIGEINRTDLYECPVCGSDITADAQKCPICNTEFGDMDWMKEELSMTLNKLMDCPSCGAEVTEYSSICPECGIEFIRSDKLNKSQKEQSHEEETGKDSP